RAADVQYRDFAGRDVDLLVGHTGGLDVTLDLPAVWLRPGLCLQPVCGHICRRDGHRHSILAGTGLLDSARLRSAKIQSKNEPFVDRSRRRQSASVAKLDSLGHTDFDINSSAGTAIAWLNWASISITWLRCDRRGARPSPTRSGPRLWLNWGAPTALRCI